MTVPSLSEDGGLTAGRIHEELAHLGSRVSHALAEASDRAWIPVAQSVGPDLIHEIAQLKLRRG